MVQETVVAPVAEQTAAPVVAGPKISFIRREKLANGQEIFIWEHRDFQFRIWRTPGSKELVGGHPTDMYSGKMMKKVGMPNFKAVYALAYKRTGGMIAEDRRKVIAEERRKVAAKLQTSFQFDAHLQGVNS